MIFITRVPIPPELYPLHRTHYGKHIISHIPPFPIPHAWWIVVAMIDTPLTDDV